MTILYHLWLTFAIARDKEGELLTCVYNGHYPRMESGILELGIFRSESENFIRDDLEKDIPFLGVQEFRDPHQVYVNSPALTRCRDLVE